MKIGKRAGEAGQRVLEIGMEAALEGMAWIGRGMLTIRTQFQPTESLQQPEDGGAAMTMEETEVLHRRARAAVAASPLVDGAIVYGPPVVASPAATEPAHTPRLAA